MLFKSLILASISSAWVNKLGNFPALFKPGPNKRGICLMRDSEAMKASYFLANFLTFFLSLLSFFKSSALMNGIPLALASSQCCWSPKMHTEYFGFGICLSLQRIFDIQILINKYGWMIYCILRGNSGCH